MTSPSRKRRRVDIQQNDIPAKANRVLYFILIAILLILIRIWHLSIIQYDQKLEEFQKPRRKMVIEPAARATIRDRFNLPLAINKMAYQAAILYSPIRDIPSFKWQKDAEGKRVKVFERKNYIRQLAQILGHELNLNVEHIEDLIHSKASYYLQVPFIIKEDITEKEYYRLKMLEKDWPALHARQVPKRDYPRKKVAGDVIGYLGAIDRNQYEKILHEMKALKSFIKECENEEEAEPIQGIENAGQARRRLKSLEAKAYTLHDYVGKTGIEGVYEEELRGFYGKKNYFTDPKGNFLSELPGSRPPLPGNRILLTLSCELQEFAEQLLAENEGLRAVRKSRLGGVKHTIMANKEPWIKGGAIVVLDPNTAEVLTLASYPRFDPNDFILRGSSQVKKQKKMGIHHWLESDVYLGALWNQQLPLERERYDAKKNLFYNDSQFLTWEAYLNFILPPEGKLRKGMGKVKTLSQAIELQRRLESLRALFSFNDLYSIFSFIYAGSPDHEPFLKEQNGQEEENIKEILQSNQGIVHSLKNQIDPYFDDIGQDFDKVLMVDLCRLAAPEERFSDELLEKMGEVTLENYRTHCGFFFTLVAELKEFTKEKFRSIDFQNWRKREEKNFLKEKREAEKLAKIFPKPYIDYLEQKENAFFLEFWKIHCWDCINTSLKGESFGNISQEFSPYLTHLKQWPDSLNNEEGAPVNLKRAFTALQCAVKSLTPQLTTEYFKSMRTFDELDGPTLGKYRGRSGKTKSEKHLATAFYPHYGFGFGRSHGYRQSTTQGSLFKLITAYEALVQRCQKMGRKNLSFQEMNPLIMFDETHTVGNNCCIGYTEEGKSIPQLYKGGRLPRSLAHLHIGKVDILKALEMSSNPYFSLLAGECLEDPEDLAKAAELFSYGNRTGIELPGEIPGKIPNDLSYNRTGLYAMAIGQHSLVVTPLQTALMLSVFANGGKVFKPKLVKLTVGREGLGGDDQLICLPKFPYQESLSLVGIDFPLFSSVLLSGVKSSIKIKETEIRREIFMPDAIRQILLKGLSSTTQRTYQENLTSLTRLYRQHPEAIRRFTELKDQLFGKTSTSESVENMDLDLKDGTNIYTHVWFGCISFDKGDSAKNKSVLLLKDEFGQPELIVVVYLRYGGYGKEAAPLAAQIVKKWREIKQKHQMANQY